MTAISQKDYSSVDDLLNEYNISCLAVLDTHAPQITRISTVSHHPGWFSDEVKETIRERTRCERKWRKSQTASHHEEFLGTVIRNAGAGGRKICLFVEKSPKKHFEDEILAKCVRKLFVVKL